MAAFNEPTTNVSRSRLLEEHLKEKIAHSVWLGKLRETNLEKVKKGEKTISRFKDFPFEGSIAKSRVKIRQSKTPILISKGDHPLGLDNIPAFVISIPCHRASYSFLKEMIRKIEDELYETTPAQSRQTVRNFVSVVIGVNNFYKEYDKESIRRFASEVRELRERCNKQTISRVVSVSIIPFFWGHVWKPKTEKFLTSDHFTMDKCYMIANSFFKVQYPNYGDLWFSKIMTKTGGPTRDAIPYQKIRDTILHSDELRGQIQRSRSDATYVLSLDCDFLSLKSTTSQKGLLSHYEDRIEKFLEETGEYPDVISSGYEAPESEHSALIKAGVKLDRMIRSSLKAKFVYMPEPNMAFIVRNTAHLNDISDLTWTSKVDSTMHTESRRLISNGIRLGIFNPNRFLFLKEGAIQTEIDEDWRTLTSERFRNLIPTAYTLPEIQKGLRHIHQSYAKPQVWATNIYQGMGVSVTGHMEHTITPLKQLREIYDPISLQNELPKSVCRDSNLLEETISIYLIYKDVLNYCANKGISVEEALNYFFERMNQDLIQPEWSTTIETQLRRLKRSLAVLRESYDEEQITEILRAASSTGWSIAEFYYESLGLKSGFYA